MAEIKHNKAYWDRIASIQGMQRKLVSEEPVNSGYKVQAKDEISKWFDHDVAYLNTVREQIPIGVDTL